MLLSRLLNGIIYEGYIADREITSVCSDIDTLIEGALFVAIKGRRIDTHTLLNKAVLKGARVTVTEYPIYISGAENIVVADTRKVLALIWANYYDNPARKLALTGITGTNGKTTTAYMLDFILNSFDIKSGIIGTVEIRAGRKAERASNTTPEPNLLHSLLAKMVDYGCTHAVMEVSSHALDQKRVYGIPYKVGIFTNLSVDHLDYHGTMSAYLKAKLKLFEQSDIKIANADSDYSAPFFKFPGTLGISVVNKSTFYATEISNTERGVSYILNYPEGKAAVNLKIPGIFSVYNSMCALAAAYSLELSLEEAALRLSEFNGVKGRMEYIKTDKPYNIIIDFAHTPDGLSNLLKAVRPVTKGRLIIVFGCGGDRDKSKRSMMGKIASENADISIITSDNPRSEEPTAIIEEILSGVKKGECIAICDRTDAIRYALYLAKKDDTVVLAGKGHEDYQVLKDKIIHYDEREIIKELLDQINT